MRQLTCKWPSLGLSRRAAGAVFCLAAGFAIFSAVPAVAQDEALTGASAQTAADGPGVLVPLLDSKRGRALFATKGCVLCHSVNEVGGVLGPALDATGQPQPIDVLDFAARMWRGAYAMIQFQAVEVGYQIEVSGQALGDLAAFVYDAEQQKAFSEDEIPAMIKDWIVKDPYTIEDDLE